MKQIFRNLLQLCFGIGLALIIIEMIFLRWFSPQIALQLKGLYSADAELGWRLTPDFVGRYQSSEFDAELIINSMGLRAIERSDDAEALSSTPDLDGESPYSILAIGDSFFFGSWVDYEHSSLAVLEERLQQANPAVQVHNAGVPAYGIGQHADYLERSGADFNPDLVVVGVFVGNDFSDTLIGPELYHIEDGLLVWNKPVMAKWWVHNTRTGEPTNPINWPDSTDRSVTQSIVTGSRNWARNNLHLYHFVLGLKQSLSAAGGNQDVNGTAGASTEQPSDAELGPRRESFWPAPEADLTLFDYESFYLKSYTPIVEEAVDTTLAELERIQSITQQLGADMLVVLIPTKEQVYVELWRERLALFGLTEDDVELDKPQRIFQEWATAQNVPVADLLPGFSAAAQDGKQFYYPVDKHWNEEGHRLAAELMEITIAPSVAERN